MGKKRSESERAFRKAMFHLFDLLWRRHMEGKATSEALDQAFDRAQRSGERIGPRNGELFDVLKSVGLDGLDAQGAFDELVRERRFEEALQLAAVLEAICRPEGAVLHAYARSLAGEREAGVAALEAAALDRGGPDSSRSAAVYYLAAIDEWAAVARTAPELLRDAVESRDQLRMSTIAVDLADTLFHPDPADGLAAEDPPFQKYAGSSEVH
jgi:hypothetical protein